VRERCRYPVLEIASNLGGRRKAGRGRHPASYSAWASSTVRHDGAAYGSSTSGRAAQDSPAAPVSRLCAAATAARIPGAVRAERELGAGPGGGGITGLALA
jgi:hypothetical protein